MKVKTVIKNHAPLWPDWLKARLAKLEGKTVSVEVKEVKSVRTLQQNNSLHLWYQLVADELNNAGYSVQKVMREKMDIDWDMQLVKDLLWRPAQYTITRKKSTTELTKLGDIDKVWEHLNRHLGQKFGVYVAFPTSQTVESLTGARVDEVELLEE